MADLPWLAEEAGQPWAEAFSLWLEGKAANTRRVYAQAWQALARFTTKRPWELRAEDLQGWAGALAGRGLSAPTIALYLAAVSSFYSHPTTRALGSHNPTLTIRRPVAEPRAQPGPTTEEVARLLGAISRQTVRGLRDYALILGYTLAGPSNTPWRALQWGDLKGRGVRVYYDWQARGREAREEIPPALWEAVLTYLEAAGRLGAMRAGDFVFTPLNDNAKRLPNVDAQGWSSNRPLSGEAVNRAMKRYARRAGLDARRVYIQALRRQAQRPAAFRLVKPLQIPQLGP